MWLINTATLKLEFFVDLYNARPRRYAILSHTWEDEEVSFQEFQHLDSASRKKGFKKIEMTCRLALRHGLSYAWVDTCCIDKTNNVELTEAINSMFLWYKESDICFAYLSDLQPLSLMQPQRLEEHLGQCRWFTRGWTLQELIAPQSVQFLDLEWSVVGQKASLVAEISSITGIDEDVLLDSNMLKNVAIAQKMSWAADRTTTRIEDNAYCLLGIFDIHMPMIYGEGHRAFYRLQEEIASETNDLSLFAWTSQHPKDDQEYRGIFAGSPSEFLNCGDIQLMPPMDRFDQEFAITNKGLRLETILTVENDEFVLNLQCFDAMIQQLHSVEWVGIYLTQTPRGYVRSRPSELFIASRTKWHFGKSACIYVPKTLTDAESRRINNQFDGVIGISDLELKPFQIMDAGPKTLWDSSKGLYLIGGGGRFTGYLHLQYTGEVCPSFEFIIVCGRRHVNHGHHHPTGVRRCVYDYWCAISSETCDDWASILEETKMAGQIADVPSLDHLYQSFGCRPLLTHDECEVHLPLGDLRARISICLRSGTVKDIKPKLSSSDGEAQVVDIELSFSRS